MNLATPTSTAPSTPTGQARYRLAAVSSALALAGAAHLPALADAPPGASTSVVAIVKVPKPWYAPRALVVSKMRNTIPQYAQLPGLGFKAFSLARAGGEFGGLYHWQDAASAQAWFNPAWFERVRQERGAEGKVRFLEAWVTLDNTPGGTPSNVDSAAVATLVEIPIPAGVSKERLLAEFKAAVPTYQNVPGLLRKHFTVSAEGGFGGLYLWKDEASANAWFNTAWQERVLKTYGTSAKIEWFDTPILMPTTRPENIAAAGLMVVAKP